MSDLRGDLPGPGLAQRPTGQKSLKGLAVEEFEHQEGSSVPHSPVVGGHDLWMGQRGGGPGRAGEELERGVGEAAPAVEQFGGHRAGEHPITGLDDMGHPTASDLADDLEAVGDDHSWCWLTRRPLRRQWNPCDLAEQGLEGGGLGVDRAYRLPRTGVLVTTTTTRGDTRSRRHPWPPAPAGVPGDLRLG